jgi:uncharacterized protein YkwD
MTSRTGMLSRLASATLLFIGVATSASAHITPAPTAAELECVALANQSRAAEGLAPLQWDSALAAAARFHAQRMSQEGPISHRYGGEPGLAERAASAGARFSLVEENIAIGESPAQIHDAWMHSPGHHDNLLNRQIDRIGVAIVQARGVLYAVADYAQSVALLTQAQVEAKVGAIVKAHGMSLASDLKRAPLLRTGAGSVGRRIGADGKIPHALAERRHRQAAAGVGAGAGQRAVHAGRRRRLRCKDQRRFLRPGLYRLSRSSVAVLSFGRARFGCRHPLCAV